MLDSREKRGAMSSVVFSLASAIGNDGHNRPHWGFRIHVTRDAVESTHAAQRHGQHTKQARSYSI